MLGRPSTPLTNLNPSHHRYTIATGTLLCGTGFRSHCKQRVGTVSVGAQSTLIWHHPSADPPMATSDTTSRGGCLISGIQPHSRQAKEHHQASSPPADAAVDSGRTRLHVYETVKCCDMALSPHLPTPRTVVLCTHVLHNPTAAHHIILKRWCRPLAAESGSSRRVLLPAAAAPPLPAAGRSAHMSLSWSSIYDNPLAKSPNDPLMTAPAATTQALPTSAAARL